MPIKFVKGAIKSKRALTFEDLERGDIFTSQGDKWFMKTNNIHDDCGELEGNSICLSSGFPHIFDEDCPVSKFNKEFELEYSNDDVTSWI